MIHIMPDGLEEETLHLWREYKDVEAKFLAIRSLDFELREFGLEGKYWAHDKLLYAGLYDTIPSYAPQQVIQSVICSE